MAVKGSRATPEWLQAGTKGPTLTDRLCDELDRTYAALEKSRLNAEALTARGNGGKVDRLEGRVSGLVWAIATIKNPFNISAGKETVVADMKSRYAGRVEEAAKRRAKRVEK